MSTATSPQALFYIPNSVEPGHRGDDTVEGWGTLDYSTELARLGEEHGWSGALIGTGWGRPETFTVATALAARTTRFSPLVAARPGFWSPAQFAAAAATLDRLSDGRLLVNVVSGADSGPAYGDGVSESADRYARTAEFMQIVRALWNAAEPVTFAGEHFSVRDSALALEAVPRPDGSAGPPLYFGGASPAAQRVAAQFADVQLMWGEPLADVAARIEALRALEADCDRALPPLEFGLRTTTVVRESSDEAWAVAEAKLAAMAEAARLDERRGLGAVGQQRLLDLAARGEMLDTCLLTTPGRLGGGGAASTWLVGSVDEVADALAAYGRLGISRFILSDTPYREEIVRLGDGLLPALAQRLDRAAVAGADTGAGTGRIAAA